MIGQDSAMMLGMDEGAPNIPPQQPEPPEPKQVRMWVLRERGDWELIESPLQEAVAKVRAIVGKWQIKQEFALCGPEPDVISLKEIQDAISNEPEFKGTTYCECGIILSKCQWPNCPHFEPLGNIR